jgi:putative addiction module killer protein
MMARNYFVQQTEIFEIWHMGLKDLRAKIAIARRIERLENGNFGDIKPIREGVYEMRIDISSGYRVYFTLRESILVILLAGGTKSTQEADIKKAISLSKEF